MKRLRRFDVLGFAAMIALVAVGTVSIWSAGNARAEAVFHGMWIRNLVTAGVGLVLYLLIAFFDYRKWIGLVALPAYVASLVFLVAVLLVGSEQFGGRRWLWFFQPSEVAKICVLSLLAVLFGDPSWRARIRSPFLRFLAAAALLSVPTLLILAEPDLGTALTLIPAALAMMLAAGAWRRGLVALMAAGGIAVSILLGAVYEAERPGVSPERRARILRYVPLKPHQLKRVRVFLFPEEDRLGAFRARASARARRTTSSTCRRRSR